MVVYDRRRAQWFLRIKPPHKTTFNKKLFMNTVVLQSQWNTVKDRELPVNSWFRRTCSTGRISCGRHTVLCVTSVYVGREGYNGDSQMLDSLVLVVLVTMHKTRLLQDSRLTVEQCNNFFPEINSLDKEERGLDDLIILILFLVFRWGSGRKSRCRRHRV